MKQGRIRSKIVVWILCLAMVFTTVNLPAFTAEVQATGIINITKVQSDYTHEVMGDYGGISIYFDPVEGAKSYYARLYEQNTTGTFIQIENFPMAYFMENGTTGEMRLYCSEANLKQYGVGENFPLFQFKIMAYDSHENIIAEGIQQVKSNLSVLAKPDINIEPSGIANIQFGDYSNRADITLYEKKADGTKRFITELNTDITDLDMKIDLSDYMDVGYQYEVVANAYSNNHFFRNSTYGSSGFSLMKGVPIIMNTLSEQEMEIGETTEISVETKNADTYEWVIAQGTTVIDMSEIKKHASVVGENSATISITPKDDFLTGKTIACQVSNTNGMSSTNKATIELSGTISFITFSNTEIRTGMTVGDFRKNVVIDNPFVKIDYIDVRDSSTKKKMNDTDVFESVGKNKSGYMLEVGLITNSSANLTFDLNENNINYKAMNASIDKVYVAGNTAEISVAYNGDILENKKISGYPLHVGDTLSTDVSRFQVEGEQDYTIKEVNWGILNDDNGKTLTTNDTSVYLKVTLAPSGLNELIWENAGTLGYKFADSVLKMKMGDVLFTGDFFSTEAATQYTKDETVTYIFEINDIKNPECVYNVKSLAANGKDIVSKKTNVAEAVLFNMETEGSIRYEAGLDKNANYGDSAPVEGDLFYETKFFKLDEHNTYDAFNPNLVLDKTIISMKDIASLDSGDYFTVVTATNKKYDMEKSIWGAYKLTVSHGSHSYADSWKSDGLNHWKECSCGDIKDKATHDFIWIIDREATDEEVGLKHQECTICGYKNYVPYGTIKTIDLSITEPEVGGAPDMTLQFSSDSEQYVTLDNIRWTRYKPSVIVLDEYATFEKGTEYHLTINLKPLGECKYDSNTVVKVNGKTVSIAEQNNSGELNFTITYIPGLTRIDALNFDVKYPKPGETKSDTLVTLDEAGTANIENITWYNVNSAGGITNQVSGEFENGKDYVLKIWFGVADGYYFDQKNTNVYANHSLMQYDFDINGIYYSYDMSFKCENHHLTLVPAKNVTCTSDGNKAYYTCSDCDSWFDDEDANYVITDKSEYIIPKLKHNYDAKWTADETTHWHSCITCSDKSDLVTHTFDSGKVTKEATETAEGIKTYACTVCGQTKTETIAKLPVVTATPKPAATAKPTATPEQTATAKPTVTPEQTATPTNKPADNQVLPTQTATPNQLKTQVITTAKIKSYKAKNLKNKKVVIKLKAKASGKGKLKYTNSTAKKLKKYISVSKKGKVTLKKGIKKGKYKITIVAAKTDTYAEAKKKITIKVK